MILLSSTKQHVGWLNLADKKACPVSIPLNDMTGNWRPVTEISQKIKRQTNLLVDYPESLDRLNKILQGAGKQLASGVDLTSFIQIISSKLGLNLHCFIQNVQLRNNFTQEDLKDSLIRYRSAFQIAIGSEDALERVAQKI